MTGRNILGVDESGKGDFFGPLVVAACACPESSQQAMIEAGVRDGKLLTEKRVLALDTWLRSEFPYAVVVVSPSEYNQRYHKIKNLNLLLAECHAQAINELAAQSDIDLAVSDKFGKAELVESALRKVGCITPLKQIVRGERVTQVAAASILARAEFITQMRSMESEYGVAIPRGASAQVDAAGREIVRQLGADILPQLAKMHFKNLGRVTTRSLFS
ncbi:MAG: ribonuclease HIII [bacterium]